MKFLDEAKIYIKAGDGGDGCLSFRHERFIEFGGPDGGAGGRGGSVYALAVKNVNTLIDYRYKQHFKAKNGNNGAGQNKTGKSGDDIVLKVPVGTQIFDDDKETMIVDMIQDGQKSLLAVGGNGGLGNTAFKSSTMRAPRKTTNGDAGEEKWIWLRLKLIADVGLVGLPNAGKSTFISTITNAHAKTGDYAFTTKHPQLGVCKIHDREIVIADIPGLIEDAHIGKGLGNRFLGHIERCSAIIHIIDITSHDPVLDYKQIRYEMEMYNKSLIDKPEIIVLNKIDAIDNASIYKQIQNQIGKNVYPISAFDMESCMNIIQNVMQYVEYDDVW